MKSRKETAVPLTKVKLWKTSPVRGFQVAMVILGTVHDKGLMRWWFFIPKVHILSNFLSATFLLCNSQLDSYIQKSQLCALLFSHPHTFLVLSLHTNGILQVTSQLPLHKLQHVHIHRLCELLAPEHTGSAWRGQSESWGCPGQGEPGPARAAGERLAGSTVLQGLTPENPASLL